MSDSKRRQQILIAAERLLIHYGVGKTTISDIAKEARVGVGSVYLEFSSKDDIVARIAHERHRRILERMRDASASESDYPSRLRALLDARVRAFIEFAGPEAHASDLIHCHGCEAVEEEFESFCQAETDLVAQLLLDGRRAGELAFRIAELPEDVARTILRAYMAYTPPYLYGQKFRSLDASLRRMHDVVLHGLISK